MEKGRGGSNFLLSCHKTMKQENLIKNFLKIVQIDSPTGDVEKMQDWLWDFFGRFDLVRERDAFGNLIFRTKIFDPQKSLLLTTHIDTVEPGRGIKPVIRDGVICSDSKTILGADPKAGIALIMELFEVSARQGVALGNLEIIFSTNEEEGDHTLQFADIKSKKALVLDNADAVDRIIYRGPFAKVFEIRVMGRAVYAQTDYNRGANAIVSLADTITALPWGFYRSGCVANTGIMTGGTATTIVPEEARLKGNIYCFAPDDLEDYLRLIEKKSGDSDQEFGTSTKLEILESYDGTKIDLDDQFVQEVADVYRQNGIVPRFEEKLLISSNNCLATMGIDALNLGLGSRNCHTTQEELYIEEFEKIFDVLVGYVIKEKTA